MAYQQPHLNVSAAIIGCWQRSKRKRKHVATQRNISNLGSVAAAWRMQYNHHVAAAHLSRIENVQCKQW